jgi:LysR family nitrogen assimilation transcriptional regulator
MRAEHDDSLLESTLPSLSGWADGSNDWQPSVPLGAAGLERTLDFRKLRYFVHIVAEGSFSTAALRLRIAQPALSHHVRDLEATLGVTLLTRSAHGVAPTKAGRCLYEHGITILGRVRQAAADVSAFASNVEEPVTFGLPTSVASVLAAPLITFLRFRAPNVQLRIVEGRGSDIMDALESTRMDMALLHDVPEIKKLIREHLLTEALYLVGPPNSGRGDVRFAQIGDFPLILPGPSHRLRTRLEREALSAKMRLNVAIEIDSLPNIKKLVQTKVGYSVLPASSLFEEGQPQLLDRRLIVDPLLQQTLSLCCLKGRALMPSAMQVRRLAAEAVKTLIGGTSADRLACCDA